MTRKTSASALTAFIFFYRFTDGGGVKRFGQLTECNGCATLNEKECYLFFLSAVTKMEITANDRLSIS